MEAEAEAVIYISVGYIFSHTYKYIHTYNPMSTRTPEEPNSPSPQITRDLIFQATFDIWGFRACPAVLDVYTCWCCGRCEPAEPVGLPQAGSRGSSRVSLIRAPCKFSPALSVPFLRCPHCLAILPSLLQENSQNLVPLY